MRRAERRAVPTGGLWLSVVTLLLLVWASIAGAQTATDKTFFWNRLDVDLTVLSNSDLRVTETWQVTFTSGTFRRAYRDIPTARLTDITDAAASEGDQAFTHGWTEPYTVWAGRVKNKGNSFLYGESFEIELNLPETSASTHTYTISYTVKGALRFYPGGDQVWWKAVFPDRAFPVNASMVTVNLPEGAAAGPVTSYGAPATSEIVNPRKVVFTASGPIPGGQEMEVRVQFPHGIVQGSPPPWQAGDDRAILYEERYKTLLNALAVLIGMGLVASSALSLYRLRTGRAAERQVGLVAEYLAEPPSDLSPGEAGALVREWAGTADVVATLVDLARQGVISITEEESYYSPGLLPPDLVFKLCDPSRPLRPHERLLVERLFGSGSSQKLSYLKDQFSDSLGDVLVAINQTLAERGLFDPDAVSTRYKLVIWGAVLLCVSLLAGPFFWLPPFLIQYGVGLLAPVVGLLVLSITWLIIASTLPHRTPAAAEPTARWQAFRRYLENIETYRGLREAKDLFDRYLPFAVAFGLEKSWVEKFAAVDTPAPAWFFPRISRAAGGGHASSLSGLPSLDGAAAGALTSLNAMSTSLFSMLDTTASTLSSSPSRSGGGIGGFSGGGGGGGRGGGGGGGGFR